MYDSRKTRRKKGGQSMFNKLGNVASRMGTRMANRASEIKQKAIKTTKKLTENIKSDRLTALIKQTDVKTFCCAKSEDSHGAVNFMTGKKQIGLNMFGNNHGTDCIPVKSGQCDVRGKYTHKYRCFDSKYYPTPGDIPEKFPEFPKNIPLFGDKLLAKILKGIDKDKVSPNFKSDVENSIHELNTKHTELQASYKIIQEYFDKYKDILRLPSIEQFKNSKKSANAEWYSLISDKKGRAKKIKDVNPKVFANMFKQMNAYAKEIVLRQNGLRCDSKSIELFGKFGEATENSNLTKNQQREQFAQNDTVYPDTVTPVNDKYELLTKEDHKHIEMYKRPVGSEQLGELIYTFNKEPRVIASIQDGLINTYVKQLNDFIQTLHCFINGSPKLTRMDMRKRESSEKSNEPIRYSSRVKSYILMGSYMNYENALNDHLLEITPMLDGIIEYEGYGRLKYTTRMVRYIGTVKNYIEDPAKKGNTVEEALYYGMFHNIYERNYDENNPHQTTCQHISKMGTKVLKASSEATRLTVKMLGISALLAAGVTTFATVLVLTIIPVIPTLFAFKIVGLDDQCLANCESGAESPPDTSFGDTIRMLLNFGTLGAYGANGGTNNRTKRRRRLSLRKYR